jgi:exopolysaccharide biosynthesis polyprenyl glycosylphosphotransferase
MSARPDEHIEQVASGPRPIAITHKGLERRRRRAGVYLGQTLGRALLIWVIAYSAYRHFDVARPESVGLGLIVTLVFLPLVQWSSRAARTMPLAFGTVTVDAAGALAGLIVVSALDAWFPGLGLGTLPAVLVALVSFLCIAVWDAYVRRLATPRTRIVLVGSGDAICELLDDLEEGTARPGYRVVGVAADMLPRRLKRGAWVTGALQELEGVVVKSNPELVVVVANGNRSAVFGQLLEIAGAGFSVMGMAEFYEVAFARLPVRRLTAAWFMSTLHFYSTPYSRWLKRSFDVVMALIAMLVALPFLPLIVLLVKRTPGPLLYRQERLGQFGRPFTMIKFRSMIAEAETGEGALWAQTRDPRVIPGGSLMRRARLDEIPQLWNVIRGDMSFVGPRPERPEFVSLLELEVPYWSARNLLKPGITGWAQIQAGYAADGEGAELKLAHDLWYLRHRSLVLDAVICLKTVTTLVTGSGAR